MPSSIILKEKKPNELILRGVKVLNLFYIVLIQFFPALICAYIFDKIFYDRTPEEYTKIHTFQLFLELWIHFWSILVLYYVFRNIIIIVPSPFDNLFNSGFKNNLVNEVKNGAVFSTAFIMFQTSLRDKIKIFKERIIG